MKFPDFVIIGAMKCGTTVLWHNLNKHPGISMCKNWEDPKVASTEIRFWNNGPPHHTLAKGVDWYQGLFHGECCGEKSANYIEHRSAIERMCQYMPRVKLVLCIRNPVERAYSEYTMQHADMGSSGFTMDFATAKGYLARGMYYNMIAQNILPYFPREQLHVIVQEDMRANTSGEINRLCRFLGVEERNFVVKEVTSQEATDRKLDLNKDGELKVYKTWQTKALPMPEQMRSLLIDYYHKPNQDLFDWLDYEIIW